MDFLNPALLAIVPLTVGLVAVVKGLGIPSQFAPVASIVFGVGMACFVASSTSEIVLGGIAIGLMASGLYSGTRAVVGA
ncbi:MAG: hypothetical protein KF889_01540 [Alphaproteobacteria bacterium]|nr:hypothetical protein [Alphaproteobacteria bacterium]MCW5741588.1 hypothetical protein [Alphaproteobacteria bacterium]